MRIKSEYVKKTMRIQKIGLFFAMNDLNIELISIFRVNYCFISNTIVESK